LKEYIAKRFIDEELAEHWKVDENKSSFKNTFTFAKQNKFFSYFNISLDHVLREIDDKPIAVADIGSGIGWTSALIARKNSVKKFILLSQVKIEEREFLTFVNILKLKKKK